MLFLKNNVQEKIIKDKKIKFNYKFSKRKSLVIKIISRNEIYICSPYLLSQKKIDKFINNKTDWIYKKCNQMPIKDKNTLMYLGNKYLIVRTENNDIFVKSNIIEIPKYFTEKDIELWYKNQSEIIIEEIYSKLTFEKQPKQIKIKKQKKRWGSCTSEGNIYINSKISMCKKDVIEYILYHELCHLVYMNHSKNFYSLLSQYCSDYKEKKRWLKINSQYMY